MTWNFKVYIFLLLSKTQFRRKQNGSKLQKKKHKYIKLLDKTTYFDFTNTTILVYRANQYLIWSNLRVEFFFFTV